MCAPQSKFKVIWLSASLGEDRVQCSRAMLASHSVRFVVFRVAQRTANMHSVADKRNERRESPSSRVPGDENKMDLIF
jgi:hypothetical protein